MRDFTDVILSMWPPGTLGNIDTEGDLYKAIKGMAANHKSLYDFLKELAYIREPKLTSYLSDLEKEYGLLPPVVTLSDTSRRENLHGIVYATPSTGAYDYLEQQLQNAGFPVQVHVNSPAIDPALFFGGAGGEMITNNVFYDRTIQEARDDRRVWSYVFFIGGDALRDETTGELLAVAPIIIPDESRDLFRELVLKYKPLHSWGVAVINDVDYFTFSQDDEQVTDAPRGFADDEQTTGGYWGIANIGDTFLIDDVSLEFVVEESAGGGPVVISYLKDE